MPILIVLALMALPFVEVWLMIVVGGWIGVPWTLASLVALMILGVAVLRRAGTKAFRDADEALRSGEQPRGGLLDPLMLMAGGILLVIPGYLTAAVGLLLVLPFTRPLLRWAFTGWAQRRMRRMQDRMEAELLAQGVRVPGQSPFGQNPFEPGRGRGPSDGAGTGADGGQERTAPSRGRVIQGHFEPDDTEQGQS